MKEKNNILENVFNNEDELLIFYHTSFRNVLNLTTLSFVSLAFADSVKNKQYSFLGGITAMLLSISAIYLNYTLIKIFLIDDYKYYKYFMKYFKINITIFLIQIFFIGIILLKIFKYYKINNFLFK